MRKVFTWAVADLVSINRAGDRQGRSAAAYPFEKAPPPRADGRRKGPDPAEEVPPSAGEGPAGAVWRDRREILFSGNVGSPRGRGRFGRRIFPGHAQPSLSLLLSSRTVPSSAVFLPREPRQRSPPLRHQPTRAAAHFAEVTGGEAGGGLIGRLVGPSCKIVNVSLLAIPFERS